MVPTNIVSQAANGKSRQRVRRPGQHRGWSAAMRTPACIARDIACSIQLHEVHGSYGWVAEQYTDDAEIIALVNEILAR